MSNFPVSLPPATPTAGTMAAQTLDDMDGLGLEHSELLGRIITDLAAVCAKVGIDGSAVATALDKIITDHLVAADPHAGYVLESLADAKGDIYTATANNAPARLAVGTDGQVLTADSSASTGLAYTTPAPPAPFDSIVNFSELTGADDSAMLADFCTTYSAATYKPTLVLDENRSYTFTEQQELYSGFAMVGGGFRSLDQARASSPITQKVRLRLTTGTGWLTLPTADSQIFGIHIAGLSIDATSSTCNRMFQPDATCVIWTSTLRDISYQNGPGILGSASSYQPLDACTIGGFWNLNNITSSTIGNAFHIGGADCRIVPEILLVDSPPSLMDATGCLWRFSSMSKSVISNVYMTCEQHMGMIIAGTSATQPFRIDQCDIEGRNASTPSYGCLVRISSSVNITNSWLSFGMSAPSSANGGEPNNRGIIHIDEGVSALTALTYEPATGVSTSVPFIYVTTGSTWLSVANIIGKTAAGSIFKPVMKIPSSFVAGTDYYTDGSVTIVTY